MATHELLDRRLNLYQRPDSRYWQCSAFIGGRNYRMTTKYEEWSQAKDVAEDWYLELRGKHKRGELRDGMRFADVAKKFEDEYGVLTHGQRNARYVKDHSARLKNHLIPFFGDKIVSEITTSLVQDYRVMRYKETMEEKKKPPSVTTMKHEMVTLRHVLNTASRHGWLSLMPDLREPYGSSNKISHRAWFSPAEYKTLYEATRARAKNPLKARFKWQSEQLHDYVLFMANTGLRPDEAARLEFRDVSIVDDDDSGETILEIEVRGKRGVGYCKSTASAVLPFQRLQNRLRNGTNAQLQIIKTLPTVTDKIFPKTHFDLFRKILKETNLKKDREDNPRTFYSLRHTYICFRLIEGADIYQIAKNCRTSVEMIEKHYAAHLKNSLDATAINRRRPRKVKKVPIIDPDEI